MSIKHAAQLMDEVECLTAALAARTGELEQAEREGHRLSDVATFQFERANKLEAERDQARRERDEWKDAYYLRTAERDQAEATLERVRGALEEIKGLAGRFVEPQRPVTRSLLSRIYDVARAAAL